MTGKKHTHTNQHFVPAAGHDWLLPFYDPVWALLGGRSHLKAFVARAEIEPGHNVLEIGCGTGNLTLMVKRSHPEAQIVGLDPDPKALARARAKAARAALTIQLDQGFSQELPYPDTSFDVVFSSFMFHHLDLPTKEATLREVRRVLVPGGSLHLVDFGGPARLTRLFHSSGQLRDNAEVRVLTLMREAGFGSPEVMQHRFLGGITQYRACA
jgi:ubiquinone/menaquinone biosynthesis C-methylase UbiE